MPADEAPKGAEAVPEAMVEAALCGHWDSLRGDIEDFRREIAAALAEALRADPLREYIRHMTESLECPMCEGRGEITGMPTRPCRSCGTTGRFPRYQAEGGAEAFIAGLEARL